jgi:hypothetical protein
VRLTRFWKAYNFLFTYFLWSENKCERSYANKTKVVGTKITLLFFFFFSDGN